MPQEKEGEEYLLAGAKDVMARCGVLCSSKPREAFKAGGGLADQLRALVEGEAAGGQMSSRPWESESGVLLEQVGREDVYDQSVSACMLLLALYNAMTEAGANQPLAYQSLCCVARRRA